MPMSDYPDVQELAALIAQHPNVTVTRRDSIKAGNCEAGTKSFIDTYFSKRRSVKVSELAPYLHIDGVQYVLMYVFRRMEETQQLSE